MLTLQQVYDRLASANPISSVEFSYLNLECLAVYLLHYEHLNVAVSAYLNHAELAAAVNLGELTLDGQGLINCLCGVDLACQRLTRLPYRFGKVGGNFYCGNNQLVSLDGAPIHVGGYFNCAVNRLISLDGAPKSVGGNFYCSGNATKFRLPPVDCTIGGRFLN